MTSVTHCEQQAIIGPLAARQGLQHVVRRARPRRPCAELEQPRLSCSASTLNPLGVRPKRKGVSSIMQPARVPFVWTAQAVLKVCLVHQTTHPYSLHALWLCPCRCGMNARPQIAFRNLDVGGEHGTASGKVMRLLPRRPRRRPRRPLLAAGRGPPVRSTCSAPASRPARGHPRSPLLRSLRTADQGYDHEQTQVKREGVGGSRGRAGTVMNLVTSRSHGDGGQLTASFGSQYLTCRGRSVQSGCRSQRAGREVTPTGDRHHPRRRPPRQTRPRALPCTEKGSARMSLHVISAPLYQDQACLTRHGSEQSPVAAIVLEWSAVHRW